MAVESAFGRVLSEYRKRRGMSRSQLAEASGLSYPYVSQLETGLRKPSRQASAQLAEALGIDPLALEAAVPPSDPNSASFQRSLRAQEALLSGRPVEVPSFDALEISGGPPEPAPSSREDLIGQVVDLVEELAPDDRLDALADVQKLVLKRLLGKD